MYRVADLAQRTYQISGWLSNQASVRPKSSFKSGDICEEVGVKI